MVIQLQEITIADEFTKNYEDSVEQGLSSFDSRLDIWYCPFDENNCQMFCKEDNRRQFNS